MVGAIIQLGSCFDLMDTKYTSELAAAFVLFKKANRAAGLLLPKNRGNTPEKKLRLLDCAVINFYLKALEEQGQVFDTVRCAFLEGPPAFPHSHIRHQSHVQLAVRNPACIVGVFRPMMRTR